MSRVIDPKKLTGIFQMVSNVSERVKFSYGAPPDDVINFLLRMLIAPSAAGTLSATSMVDYVKKIEPKQNQNNVDPDKVLTLNSSQFRFSSTVDTNGKIDKNDIENPRILLVKSKQTNKNSTEEFKTIDMLTALDAADDSNYRACAVSYVLSTLPFLHPSVGRSADVEIFLNYMPSYVVSRMVPYVDVEFQFTRPYTERQGSSPSQLASPGLLKFLNGAMNFNSPAKDANDVMALGHRILRAKDEESVVGKDGGLKQYRLERSYAGMEMFTSPQTLVNPAQLDQTLRYKEIIDPFRPFMSLVSLQLSAAPTVGYGTYKTGTMVIKLHDRSRLTEVGDLLQPEIYTRTMLWVTYGWMHPIEPDNAYATFINNNMLMRELYGIKNAAYVFENDGQVTITLQLYTLGATEMMDIKVSAGPDPKDGSKSVDAIQREMEMTVQQIAFLANKMGLLGTESGGTADIRAYQIINQGARGEFPNLKEVKLDEALKRLSENLSKSKADAADAKALRDALGKLYATEGKDKDKRYSYDVKRKNAADAIMSERFKQLAQNDKDPWLPVIVPDVAKSKKNSPYASNTFADEIKKYTNSYTVKSSNTNKQVQAWSGVCSFGKLLATFIAPQIAESQIADELQVFFYAFNESAGLAAGQCIANFPIDLGMFLDQYSLYTQQIGTNRMSLAEFLRFVIDAQLHDYRSLGYGTRDYYMPYKSNEVATLDEKKKDAYGDWMTQHQSKYGPFHIPTIDTYIEAVPITSDPESIIDLLSDIVHERSAKDDSTGQSGAVRRGLKNKYALRIHIYDKQLDPYKSVETAIKPPVGKPGHMILVSQNEDAIAAVKKSELGSDAVKTMLQKMLANEGLTEKESKLAQGVFVPMDLTTNKRVKDYISSIVPTITFGTNASVLTSAQLSTNQDALLSTVQMMKQSGRTNPQTPAGAGPGGLPITVIPGALTMTMLGCPMLQLTQKYFVDFNTGTTADNVYCVNKLSHMFTQGKFESTVNFVWADAYGRIAGAGDVSDYVKYLEQSLEKRQEQQQQRQSGKK